MEKLLLIIACTKDLTLNENLKKFRYLGTDFPYHKTITHYYTPLCSEEDTLMFVLKQHDVRIVDMNINNSETLLIKLFIEYDKPN